MPVAPPNIITELRGVAFMDLDTDIRDKNHSGISHNIGMELMVIDGSLTKVIGNSIIPFTLPAGTNQCIGSGEDIENQRLVYAIWNSLGNYSVIAYNLQSNTCQMVLETPYWNFQLSNKIRKMEIVPSEKGSLLYLTDGYDNTSATDFSDTDFNSGREINIDMAIAYTENRQSYSGVVANGNQWQLQNISDTSSFIPGQICWVQDSSGNVVAWDIASVSPTTVNIFLYLAPPPLSTGFIVPANNSYYNFANLQTIQRIKYPPPSEPYAEYDTDTNFGKNFFELGQKLCQFAYCYQYYDDSLSVYSPLSALTVPYGDENIAGGDNYLFELLNNVINITIYTGNSLVKQIVLGVRFGNIGEFGTFITLNKEETGIPDDSSFTYSFYNDRNITIIDQADWIRLYDSSPQVENTLKLIETDTGDNLVVAQYTEGFDIINPDIVLQWVPVNISSQIVTPPQPSAVEVDSYGYIWSIDFPNTLIAGTVFVYTNNPYNQTNFTDSYTYKVVVTAADEIYPPQFWTQFYNWLILNQQPSSPSYSISPAGQNIEITSNTNGNFRICTASIYSNIQKFPTCKSGAKGLWGLEYGRDEGWEGTVQVMNVATGNYLTGVNGTEMYIPFITEVPQYAPQGNQVQNTVMTSIYHQPPIWATKYRWVYAGNNTVASFIQFNALRPGNSNGQTLMSLTPLTDYGVPATPLAPATGTNPNSILAYNFTPGDRCRFISQYDTTNNTNPVFSSLYDVQVLSYDAETQLLCVEEVPESIFLNPETLHMSVLIELYTPAKTTQNPIYYELSQTFEIGNPHTPQRYHKGLTQNQDPNNLSTVPAITTLVNGDTWLKTRWMTDNNGDGGNDNNWINVVEDYNFSDFYVSDSYDKGRPNVVDPYAKRLSVPNCRHSQIYIYDTQINGLSSFWDGQGFTTPLSSKNGIITGLELVGFEMEVFQSQKVTSVLIQRLQMENTDGSSNQTTVSGSISFFGSHTPRSDRYGTIYPESVCGDKTHRYCFDVINGGFIRVATDRNWNLSEYYLINKWTLALSDAMKNAGTANFNVYGYYDMGYDKVYWTITYNVPEFKEIFINVGGIPIVEIIPNPAYNPPSFVINGITYTTPITIVFCENGAKESKGFQGFMPFHGEFYGGIGNVMFSFKNGNIYKHWDGAIPNSFYGGASVSPNDNDDCQVEFVFNQNPQSIKTPKDITQYCDNLMFCADKDISIPPSPNYPSGQVSRLLSSKWNAVESRYSAFFLRNSLGIEPNAILNAGELKAQAMKVRLRNQNNLPLTLSSVIVNSLISTPTPQ